MHLRSLGPAFTRRLGVALGKVSQQGDVIALYGELGAGKTCLVQGLARGLGVARSEPVSSPTFNIVVEHPARLPLYHVDLYRIGSAGELAEIGLDHYLFGDGLCAVEWFDRFPELRPADRLDLRIAIDGPRRRTITLEATGPRSDRLLAALET